jgi:hypothetical protein
MELSNTGETIIIDGAEMNATAPDGSFLNRKVTGDYNNVAFPIGLNDLRVTGTLTSVDLIDYSRWI